MSRGINKVILVGNLGNAPEIRHTPGGQTVANFSIATSESWTDKATSQKQERTEWHRIVAFRRLAEIIEQYVSKGSKVYVEGRLQTRKWQGQDGIDRYSTEIIADQLEILSSRDPGTAAAQQPRPAHSTPQPDLGPVPDFDDDIPF